METTKGAAVGVEEHGLKQYELKTSTVVFMIFCLVSAGCFGIEEMIPEASVGKHSNIATIGFAVGFAVMMVLDVALG